jgi:hypothetical protein
METQKNIASTFSPKSDLILTELMKKHDLGERGDIAELILTKYTMFFSRGEISEIDMINSIQKDLNLPPEKAKQISTELITKIIPTLWDKMPKEERDALLNKKEKEVVEPRALPKTKPPIGFSGIIEKEKPLIKEDFKKEEKLREKEINPDIKKPKRIKKSLLPKKTEEIEKLIPKPKQQKTGSDSYREPIE